MSGVGFKGAATMTSIGTPGERGAPRLFDFSTPAGWAMLWWLLAVFIIVVILWTL